MHDIKVVLNERFLLQQEYLGDRKEVNQVVPVVSVTVTTYQHVNYIKKCIDGILMQQTDFPFEIILGEDGSIDGTQEICKEYAEKYPDKIRLFIRDRKLSQFIGSDGNTIRFNGIWNRMSARGKYIAWCEGDDYWIDLLKLQKQVDFLNSNEDYGLVCTDVNFYNQSTEHFEYSYFKNKNYPIKYTFDDFLINAWFLAPCTWLFRRQLLLDSFLHTFVVGDLPMLLDISLCSKIKFLKDVTAVYRVLNNSASHIKEYSKQEKFAQRILQIQLFYLKKAGGSDLLQRKIIKQWLYSAIKTAVKYKQFISCLIYIEFLLISCFDYKYAIRISSAE